MNPASDTETPPAPTFSPEEMRAATEREETLVKEAMRQATEQYLQQRILLLSAELERTKAENATLRRQLDTATCVETDESPAPENGDQ